MNERPYGADLPGHSAALSSAVAHGQAIQPPANDPRTIYLSKPLMTHQGNVTRLSLREPTAKDFIAMERYPFTIKNPGTDRSEIDINFKLTSQWIAMLTDTDELIVSRMPRRDFLQAVEKVVALIASSGDDLGN